MTFSEVCEKLFSESYEWQAWYEANKALDEMFRRYEAGKVRDKQDFINKLTEIRNEILENA